MSVITWAAKHCVFTIDFLREEHTVAVERQKGILALEKLFEIKSISNPDGRTTISITPSYPIAIFDKSNARVVLIFRMKEISITTFHHDRFVVDFPVNSIFTEASKNVHLHCFVVAAENPCIAVAKRHNSRVKNTVRGRDIIPTDNRVFRITPHYIGTTRRAFLPRIFLTHYFCFSY